MTILTISIISQILAIIILIFLAIKITKEYRKIKKQSQELELKRKKILEKINSLPLRKNKWLNTKEKIKSQNPAIAKK